MIDFNAGFDAVSAWSLPNVAASCACFFFFFFFLPRRSLFYVIFPETVFLIFQTSAPVLCSVFQSKVEIGQVKKGGNKDEEIPVREHVSVIMQLSFPL